jgi:hypothetical protein
MEKVLPPRPSARLVTPGAAYWGQRGALAASADRLRALHPAVGRGSDLTLPQWAQLLAVTLEFQPDLVIELGRGYGNSTCVFAEAFHLLGGTDRWLLSICRSDDWHRTTRAAVAPLVPAGWLDPIDARVDEILPFDFAAAIGAARRPMLFWDAHGMDIAECVLGEILPLMAAKDHLVAMHDLSDARNAPPESRRYGRHGLWRKNDWDGTRVFLGHIQSAVEQAVAIVDFTTRNRLTIESADRSIAETIGVDPARVAEMQSLLGDLFALHAHWFWFSCTERGGGELTFPWFEHRKVREVAVAGPA